MAYDPHPVRAPKLRGLGLEHNFGRVGEPGPAPLCWSRVHVIPIGALAHDTRHRLSALLQILVEHEAHHVEQLRQRVRLLQKSDIVL